MTELEKLLDEVKTLNEQKEYEKVIEKVPEELLTEYENDDLYAEKAQACFRVGEKEQCNILADKSLLINPLHAKACHYKGNYYWGLKENSKAIEYYKKAIEINPALAYPYNGLGNVYYALKDLAKAIEYYTKAIELDSENNVAYNNLGAVYYEIKEYQKATDCFKRSILLSPKDSYSYNGLGNVYNQLNEHENAIIWYNRAIEINPKSSYPYNGIGNVHFNKGEYTLAIELYEKAIDLDPNENSAYNNLGLVFQILREYDKAIEFHNKAILIDGGNSMQYYHLALAYELKGNYENAIVNFEKYIRLTNNENDLYTQIAQSKINNLRNNISNPVYKVVNKLVDEIKDILLYKKETVTHYTSFSTAQNLVLKNSRFRLSEGTFLNDTSEGRELFRFLKSSNAEVLGSEMTTVATKFSPKPFIGSFVSGKKHDDLALWRMYGKENKEDGKGCTLTVDRIAFLDAIHNMLSDKSNNNNSGDKPREFEFYRVAYWDISENKFFVPDIKTVDLDNFNEKMEELRKHIVPNPTQDILALLNTITYLFKTAEYKYEHEVRLVIDAVGIELIEKIIDETFEPPKVYIKLVSVAPLIKSITLGPKVEGADEWAAAFSYILEKSGHTPAIYISHLPYK